MKLYTVEARNRARELATARCFGLTLPVTLAVIALLSLIR